MAITALVLACVSWVMCGVVTAIPAMFVGKMELGKIDRGESSPAGRTLAQAAFWISGANVGLTVVALCLYLGFLVVAVGMVGAGGVGAR